MITVTYTGLGSSLYEGGASLLYDNKYVGAVMANWTRGVAKVQIRATGPVGRHTIEIADAISFKYLNIEQSPIPWGVGFKFGFTVTKDNGRPAPRIDWPAAVAPTVDARTTLDAVKPQRRRERGASASLSATSGQVLVEGRRHRRRVDARRAGRPRLVDRRRQPGQLHRHLLVVRVDPARNARRRPPTGRSRARSRCRTVSAAGTSSR